MANKRNQVSLEGVATIVLRLLALGFLGLAALAAWHVPDGDEVRVIRLLGIWGPLVLAAGLLVVSVLPATTRIGCMISTIVFAAGFLALESYLARDSVMMPRIAETRRLGMQFDGRTLKDVVLDRRAQGDSVTLPTYPDDYFFAFGDAVIFSNPPLSTVVLCNELGWFETIETDEYGFNNPPGSWNAPKVDVLLVGDSYVEGHCVPREARLAEVVRERYPRTVNLSRGGLGPLGELAILREYAPALRPKVIVWGYFDNDWEDLRTEVRVPTLSRYLDDRDFTQNLYSRRDQVNQLVTDFMERRIERLAATRNLPFKGMRQFVRHWANRVLEGPEMQARARPAQDQFELREQFTTIMREARRVAHGLGSELIFVHLRDFGRPPSEAAQSIAGIVSGLGIPTIDLADAVRERFENAREMHRLSRNWPVAAPANLIVHYNAEGHRFAGETIAAALDAHLARAAGREAGAVNATSSSGGAKGAVERID
jgi:hypothetical protein